jgi:hypothetical protein
MDGLAAPISLFFFVIIVGILILHSMARQRTKDYKNGKRKFRALSTNLLQLKEHVMAESDRWPIYARPVMFTDIDHDAQIEFAKAQQALYDADQIFPQIEIIPEPETPEQFRVDYLFNVSKNIKTISLWNQLVGSVNYFEQRVVKIESSIKSLRADRYRVESKRREVQKLIDELKVRTEKTNSSLKSMDAWGSAESHSFSWIANIADNCHLEALERINRQSDEEQGYLEHAIADVYVEIGNFSLDCIDLYIESQSVSRRYELDIFSNLFKESIVSLQSIIEIQDWNGWRKLQRARLHIDKFPETRQLAKKSLFVFKQQQQNLEILISLINDLDLVFTIGQVDSLEKECTYYWYSYEERKGDWEKALGAPPKFPSAELNRFQTLLITEIYPPIGADMFIKQSQAMILIRKMSQILEFYNAIKDIIRSLERELNLHKEAQKAVNALLENQGKATVMLAELKLAISDTSPDFNDFGTKLLSEHQAFVERANKARGANFPDLKNDLEQLILKSGTLLDKHNLQLTNLISEYKALCEQIEKLIKEMDKYISYNPAFSAQHVKSFMMAYKAGWVMLQNQATAKYSWLRPIVNDMNAWISKVNPLIIQAREKYQAFQTGKKQVEKYLSNTKDQIQNQRQIIERKWGWYKNEILPKVDRAEQALDLEIKGWKRVEERKWAEFTIYKAIAKCENLVKFSEEILNELNQQVGNGNYRQKILNDKSKDIKDLIQENTYKLSQQDQTEIFSLIQIAMKAENYESAEKCLEYALNLAMKRATFNERREIKKVINIYSGGGAVVMGNLNTSGGGFTGRDNVAYSTSRISKTNKK